MNKKIALALAIGVVVLVASPVWGEVLYNLTSLDISTAWSINNSGQIVGISGGHAALFDPTGGGNHIDLGTPGERYSMALSINDSGQIVGYTLTENFELYATLFDPIGGSNNIYLGGDSSLAASVNNSGQIVGEFGGHAALFGPTGGGDTIDLGTPGEMSSVAISINDSGQIVGASTAASGEMHATLFDPTGGGNNIDLGSLEGLQSQAYSINNSGQIVGEVFNRSGYYRATLFDPTGGGDNIDLNNLIYPNLGWILTSARSINDKGYIVGVGRDPNDDWRAYLLTPIKPVTLMRIEIVGPNEVADNFSASYKAIAYYDNNSVADVTDLTAWAVEPNMYASIEAGVLTTKDIIKDKSATIWAGYSDGGVTFEDEKAIDILAICPTGTALSFDGIDDYVDCGSGEVFPEGNSDRTLSGWIKTTATGLGQLLSYGTGATGQAMTLGHYGGAVFISAWAAPQYSTSDFSVNDGKWHNIAFVLDSQVGKTYVDGLLRDSRTFSPNTNTSSSKIGSRLDAAVEFFNGEIDEVAIYNRALSAEEIWVNMHKRLTGNEMNLVAYWGFDEGDGQIVSDLSGNGNSGQLGNSVDVDDSDPTWLDSDAPIGYCNPYLIAIMATKLALERKLASLEEVEAALAHEWIAYEALEEWLESADFGDLNKGDIVTARQAVHSAIQHEEQSIGALQKSIEKLKFSLSILDNEPKQPSSPPHP